MWTLVHRSRLNCLSHFGWHLDSQEPPGRCVATTRRPVRSSGRSCTRGAPGEPPRMATAAAPAAAAAQCARARWRPAVHRHSTLVAAHAHPAARRRHPARRRCRRRPQSGCVSACCLCSGRRPRGTVLARRHGASAPRCTSRDETCVKSRPDVTGQRAAQGPDWQRLAESWGSLGHP
eukprot:scaffold11713_cov65-Phaeocystis_antarctica.AAC.2